MITLLASIVLFPRPEEAEQQYLLVLVFLLAHLKNLCPISTQLLFSYAFHQPIKNVKLHDVHIQ